MLYDLFNASMIWLASLAVYELFLKQETFHGWNRAYLLATLLAGLCLPLLSWDQPDVPAAGYIRVPAAAVQAVHTRVANVATAVQAVERGSKVNWVLLIYIAGVVVSAGLYLKEAFALAALYKSSTRRRVDGFTIVETAGPQSPFSIFRLIFIGNQDQYSAAELRLIISHEHRHAALLHSVDVLLISFLQAALWFHPLVWWYGKRLRFVHEYQADFRQRPIARQYGTFLLEQQLLAHAPSFTHSFFQSPIKNRIMMLTKKSSARPKLLKYLLVVPLAATMLFACREYGVKPDAKKQKGNIVRFKGNEFEMNADAPQTIKFKDSTGTVQSMDFSITPYPIKMNGEVIHWIDSAGPMPVLQGQAVNLPEYLYSKLKSKFDQLGDGAYNIVISYLVVDRNGKIVYYSDVKLFPDRFLMDGESLSIDGGIVDMSATTNYRLKDNPQDSVLIRSIEEAADRALNNNELTYKPAIVGGKAVHSLGNDHSFDYRVVIKNHQSSFEAIPERITVKFSIPEKD